MRFLIILCLPVLLLLGCQGNHSGNANDTSRHNSAAKNGAPYSKKAVDSLVASGAVSPDSLPDGTPSQAEERERIRKSYDDVDLIDTALISNNDTLHFHSKRYCLKQSVLIVPKVYDMDNSPKAFETHPFAIDLWLKRNQDTVFKHHFTNSDFDPFYTDQFGGNLKKYGSILDVYLSKKQPQDHNQIKLWVSLAIPSTDLGRGVLLMIDKNGQYKVDGTED